ncbi:hypothetical protein KI688_001608 [Linnemannia hyalina]|uniref:Uncharacterized protein n=1 Tax=Linnemannia hyalina TaxID=64524 RepID=A0A9P7XTJ1_9FUNG|nr:hypothetical protein KI688_001608 [Linnemannia hyalina]
MKIKILGPVLLLTLATQFARAAESAEGDNNNSNNNAIADANLAAVPDPPTPAAEQVVALNRQEAGEALEVAVDGLVEAAAKAFEQDEEGEDEEGEDEDDEDMETVDTDDEEDGNDEDEDKDKEGNEDDDDEDDLAEDEDQERDEALLLEGDDFHYADPLTATYDAQTAKCKQPQQHHEPQQPQEQHEQEQQTITIQKRDKTPLFPQIDEHTLSALATAEIGGACIDSFVNFALRFRERCSIKCLKTFSHVFSNPDVLGILDCFGCSNFFVSGFYALGIDCAGIFAAYPKPANATKTLTPTGTAKGSATATTVVSTKADAGGDYRLGQVKPEDSALPPIDFSTMLTSLGQISSGDIQDWANIGSDLAKVISGGNSGKSEGEEGSRGNEEVDEERATASKNLFNQFVSKAASFANWTLTPEMLDQTGVFGRVQQSLGL